jgi:3-dehydroquinate synthase
LTKDPQLLQAIVFACAKIKADIVAKDEKEMGLRANLNYGHTFAHVLETYYHHSGLKHGQAVLLGMVCANYVANRINLLDDKTMQRIQTLIFSVPLALPTTKNIPQAEYLVSLMYRDKKVRAGKIRLILPKAIGDVLQYEISDERILADSFTHLFKILRAGQ